MILTTNQLLLVLRIVTWIIFIGLCINAGGLIFNVSFTLIQNPIAAENLWLGADFSSLLDFDKGYFIAETMLMIVVAVSKAILFYLIVKVLQHKKLDFIQPFNLEMKSFMSSIAYLALGIGLFSYSGINYTKWLVQLGVNMPDIQTIHFGGPDVWIFMGVIFLVISQLFKRGVQIQSENDLTI